jgi:predicted MFS family arabinose efflux permease
MTGIVLSGVGVGTMLGAPIAGRLIQAYEWRFSFMLMGIFFLSLLVVAAQFLRRDPDKMGLLPYGVSTEKSSDMQEPNTDKHGLRLAEARKTRQFWMLFITYIFFGICQMAIMVHIVSHATDIGILELQAANILVVIGALIILGMIISGIIADRIGSKKSFCIALGILALALLWLQIADEMWAFYLFAVLFGFGAGGGIALMSTQTADLFGIHAHGAIMGVISFGYTIGCTIGPILAGRIFDTTGNYQIAFGIFAAVSIIGLLLIFRLKPLYRQETIQR